MSTATMLRQAQKVREQLERRRALRPLGAKDPSAYRDDPVGYARDVLGADFVWDQQAEIAEALRREPFKVLVKSGHNVGKTWAAAWLINWFHDSFKPGVVISTAPTFTD